MEYELVKELKDAGFQWDDVEFFYPSLSELIEACGDGFFSLFRYKNCYEANGDLGKEGRGITPEEAVARLWIALNKKLYDK